MVITPEMREILKGLGFSKELKQFEATLANIDISKKEAVDVPEVPPAAPTIVTTPPPEALAPAPVQAPPTSVPDVCLEPLPPHTHLAAVEEYLSPVQRQSAMIDIILGVGKMDRGEIIDLLRNILDYSTDDTVVKTQLEIKRRK